MIRVLFLHAALDPVASGELRRLGLPAQRLDGADIKAAFAWAPQAGQMGDFDVVVLPLEALDQLPRLIGAGAAVVVHVAGPPDLRTSQAGLALAGASRGLAAIVGATPAAAAWARDFAGSTPVWLAADPTASGDELAAAATRFGCVGAVPKPEAEAQGADELWFCEPGDLIHPVEVAQLAARWKPRGRAVAIAPPPVLAWLAQAGVPAAGVAWSPQGLDRALASTPGCVFAGPATQSRLRRQARAARAGAAFAEPGTDCFDPHIVAATWTELIRVAAARSAAAGVASAPGRLLIFLDLVQDLDLALPLLDALSTLQGPRIRVVVSAWLQKRSPRVGVELARRGVVPEVVERFEIEAGSAPDLAGCDCVLAIVESSLPAHARAHRLFARARAVGLPTFSCQHGVENIGLNAPEIEGEGEATLLSDALLVWFGPDHTPPSVQPDLRPRLVHVGRPRARRAPPPDFLGAVSGFKSVAAVFENLHWSRYSPAWRTRFLVDCADFAESDPTLAVVLKPHHTGLWSVRNRHLIRHWPPNLILADPTDSFWEPYTAPDLIAAADLVITTPSTVALDAAQGCKPVAVAAYGLEVDAYSPLPLLQGPEDWRLFAKEAGSVQDAHRRAAFETRSVLPGDAAARAADHIAAAARRRRALAERAWATEA